MKLKPIGNCHIDVTRISYIGPMDKHIKHGTQKSSVTHFFLVIVDGHPVEIYDHNEDIVQKHRENLIDELTRTDGYIPG